MKVLISGGGTGGHVFPAIAIADAIKKQKPDTEFLFVGAKGKIEMEKVPKAGYPIEDLDITGFKRSLSFQTLNAAFKLLKSTFKAIRIVRKFKPDVAIGVGGYASGPTLKIAGYLGIPTMIQEQNSYAGVTNKLLANKAKKVFVAYENMDRFFDAGKIELTGNPVRSGIDSRLGDQPKAKLAMGFDPSKKVVLVMGGSLGARTINQAMSAAKATIEEAKDVEFIWQSGKLYLDEFSKHETAKLSNVRIMAFIEDMDLTYAAADIIVGRAGALTISELAIVGKPAILIPSPNVAEDHQTHNAMALVNKGAALLVKDREAMVHMLPEILDLLNNEVKMQEMRMQIKKLAKPHADQDIASIIIKEINA